MLERVNGESFAAASKGKTAAIKEALERGAQPNAKTPQLPHTPIFQVAMVTMSGDWNQVRG